MICSFRNKRGNTLPTVLFFASCGLIIVTLYLAHQARSTTLANRSPSSLQALLNARSGIYKAMEKLSSDSRPDTLPTLSSIDQIFRMDMFGSIDTTDADPDLSLDGKKNTILLFTGDSTSSSEVSLSAQGMYCQITSEATVVKTTRIVEAMIGSSIPARPDTVLILENNLPVRGTFRGKVKQYQKGISDTITTSKHKKRQGQLNDFLAGLKERVASDQDTSIFDIPLTVQSQNATNAIPDIVNSHLLLDGTFSEIIWKEKRKITVYGDLQITGSFKVENLDFAVGGEIKVLDKSRLVNVSLFSMNRIFIGDDANFQGNAMAMSSINVYGNAVVREKSSLVVAGNAEGSEGAKQNPQKNYSIFLSESSQFDGTAIALGNPGGIKTDPQTKISGILWAEKIICHGGNLSGLAQAGYLVDCSQLNSDSLVNISSIKENSFSGSINPLSSIMEYRMPYLMGEPLITSWKEY